MAGTAELVRNGEMSPATAILMLLGAIAATTFVVFMERAQRRITVNYARRQQGRRLYCLSSCILDVIFVPHIKLERCDFILMSCYELI